MGFQSTKRIDHGSNADIVLDVVAESDLSLTSPDGTPTITITDPDGTEQVSGDDMTFEQTGRYSYDYDTSTSDARGWTKAAMSVDVDTGTGTRTEKVVLRFEVV